MGHIPFPVISVFLALVSFFGVTLSVIGQECTEDGVCLLPTSGEGTKFVALSPVGVAEIEKIQQGPRLDTLDGKTIAIVGGSFMAYVTHPELKRLILEEFPTAKVLVLSEIGSAGPWPGPGVVRRQKDEFLESLKEKKVDAVISGNGGCGLCTPKEMGSCIATEYLGLPSVMIAAPGFTDQARIAAQTAGVPVPRVAEYPGAFSTHSREELLENTQKVLWPQIKKALMTPISEKEVAEAEKTDAQEQTISGSLDEINLRFAQNGWTDGLPIIPPTKERVAEFLKYCDLDANDVVGEIPPSYRKATVQLVAVNGVMAGCPPEYMPILVAFTKAMTDGNFRRTLASTHAWTPYCWINGPVARQLGLDSGQGEISSQKNATIGRFINLAMLNLGGYYIKQNRMGTFGYLMPWCLVEDEETATWLGWLPYHVQQGFSVNDSALTATSALSWGNNLAPATTDPQKIMEMMAWDAVEKEQFALGSGMPFVYRTILVTEFVARDLSQEYRSKEMLEDALIQTARRPVAERAYANYWGNPGSAFNPETYPLERHIEKLSRNEGGETTATPPWLFWTGLQDVETVPAMEVGKTAILVTGDANRNKSMTLPGGGFATVKIELPKNWDALMKKAGYEPLSDFFLKEVQVPENRPRPRAENPERKNGNGDRNGYRSDYRRENGGDFNGRNGDYRPGPRPGSRPGSYSGS
ncbi:MAG: hypothetical protein Q4C70_12345, partial [Planctomycetia bacterium]|nr:hypothetical protein [Planctomycetia bacterium]